METVMNKLMDDYRDVIDQAISEQSEDKKTVIRDRFLASYKANLEVGLAAVFGKVKEVKSLPPPATEADARFRGLQLLTKWNCSQ